MSYVAGGTILGVLRADNPIDAGLVLLTNLHPVRALNLHGRGLWRFLMWLAFGGVPVEQALARAPVSSSRRWRTERYRYADNDAPSRSRPRYIRDRVPTFQLLFPSTWRHRNEQRCKRPGRIATPPLWPFG